MDSTNHMLPTAWIGPKYEMVDVCVIVCVWKLEEAMALTLVPCEGDFHLVIQTSVQVKIQL